MTVKPKALPITTNVTNGNDKDPKIELLCLIGDLPSCITLNQHFTNVINKNILQVSTDFMYIILLDLSLIDFSLR